MEYLGFLIKSEGVRPVNKKVEAISKKVLFHSIGLVNYYRNMWEKGSHMLQPQTILTPDKFKFEWTEM